jgi:hypothetical protein
MTSDTGPCIEESLSSQLEGMLVEARHIARCQQNHRVRDAAPFVEPNPTNNTSAWARSPYHLGRDGCRCRPILNYCPHFHRALQSPADNRRKCNSANLGPMVHHIRITGLANAWYRDRQLDTQIRGQIIIFFAHFGKGLRIAFQ